MTTTWTTQLGDLPTINCIRGSSDNEIYAVGNVFAYTLTGKWKSRHLPTTKGLYGLAVFKSNQVYVCGEDFSFGKYNPGSDSFIYNHDHSRDRGHLNSLWGSDVNNIFGCSSAGRVWKLDITDSAEVISKDLGLSTSSLLKCIDGNSPKDIYVVGTEQFAAHYNGKSWKDISMSGGIETFAQCKIGPDNCLYACTYSNPGNVYRYKWGAGWSQIKTPSTFGSLYSLWVSSDGFIFVGAADGKIYRSSINNIEWESTPIDADAYYVFSIWGYNSNHVYAGSTLYGFQNQGVILQYGSGEGSTPDPEPEETSIDLSVDQVVDSLTEDFPDLDLGSIIDFGDPSIDAASVLTTVSTTNPDLNIAETIGSKFPDIDFTGIFSGEGTVSDQVMSSLTNAPYYQYLQTEFTSGMNYVNGKMKKLGKAQKAVDKLFSKLDTAVLVDYATETISSIPDFSIGESLDPLANMATNIQKAMSCPLLGTSTTLLLLEEAMDYIDLGQSIPDTLRAKITRGMQDAVGDKVNELRKNNPAAKLQKISSAISSKVSGAGLPNIFSTLEALSSCLDNMAKGIEGCTDSYSDARNSLSKMKKEGNIEAIDKYGDKFLAYKENVKTETLEKLDKEMQEFERTTNAIKDIAF